MTVDRPVRHSPCTVFQATAGKLGLEFVGIWDFNAALGLRLRCVEIWDLEFRKK